ncbi:hypothetical protein EU538_05115 [Candidatus Thorarchaeota archaeon]|nr:MAG: hypothetical protein EU538_05115 [Candidatus Thorarchaeota archaeon]
MTPPLQTRLTDFDEESGDLNLPPEALEFKEVTGEIWKRAVTDDKEWGVCRFDGTVMFTKLQDEKIIVHGLEAKCRWCGDELEIRGEKVFCSGRCRTYQGAFSRDLNKYLQWEGAKSYTLRKEIARKEGLQLEPRDLEPIPKPPEWSIFNEFEELDAEP